MRERNRKAVARGKATIVPGLTGAVLAGGRARRMGGRNKALLEFGGQSILDRVLAALSASCEHVIIVANDHGPYRDRGLPLFSDLLPETGSLGGLYTALQQAPSDRVFVCACDMPFVSAPLIRHLADRLEGFDAAVPSDGERLQPMHSVYDRRCAPAIRARLEERRLKIEHFLAEARSVILSPDEVAAYAHPVLTYFNVNTPDDFRDARSNLAATGANGRRRVRIEVSLFANLAKYAPCYPDTTSAILDLREGSTIANVLRRLRVPRDQRTTVLIDGRRVVPERSVFNGECLHIFPPMFGG